MEQHVRLKCLDETIEAVEYGGDRWPVERGHVVLPAGAAAALTTPGKGFTHVLPDPIVVRRAQVIDIVATQGLRLPQGVRPQSPDPLQRGYNKHKR